MSTTGDTAIVVPFPELDELLAPWLSETAEPGMPAHVTVLYPFLPHDSIAATDVDDLLGLVGAVERFDVAFRRCDRFPTVVYLAPEPEGPFRRLTEVLVARWPEQQPYGGAFDDVVPHLTLALGDEALLAEAEAWVADRLPVRARVDVAWLMAFDGARWRIVERLAFADSPVA